MFREVARKKQALSKEECVEVLKKELRGVLSLLGEDGYPYGVPLDHYYDEESGRLYFHSGKVGYKIECMKKHDKASFCVMDGGEREEGGWALKIKSVIVFGRIGFIDETEEICRISKLLSLKFTDDLSYIEKEIEKFAKATAMFYIETEHVTGKRIVES